LYLKETLCAITRLEEDEEMINKGDRVKIVISTSADNGNGYYGGAKFIVGETDDHKIYNEDMSWWFDRDYLEKLESAAAVINNSHLKLASAVLDDVPMSINFKVDGVDFDMSLTLAKKVKNILSVLV
jgi:hypothetical protein